MHVACEDEQLIRVLWETLPPLHSLLGGRIGRNGVDVEISSNAICWDGEEGIVCGWRQGRGVVYHDTGWAYDNKIHSAFVDPARVVGLPDHFRQEPTL